NVRKTYVAYRPGGRATALAVASRLHTTTVVPVAKDTPPFSDFAFVAAILGPDARAGLAGAPAVPARSVATAFLRSGHVNGTAALSTDGKLWRLSIDAAGLPAGSYGIWVADKFLGSSPVAHANGAIHPRLTLANGRRLIGRKVQLTSRDGAAVVSG